MYTSVSTSLIFHVSICSVEQMFIAGLGNVAENNEVDFITVFHKDVQNKCPTGF